MAEKKSYKACKEKGDIGTNEDIVLNENWLDLINKLDVSKMIDPLKSTGILNSKEYRDIRTEKDAGLMMSYVTESGPDGFIKFMDALRMADYQDLAANLEMELKITQSETKNFYRKALRIGNLVLEKASAMGEHVALELVKNFGSALKIGKEILIQAYEYGKPIGLQVIDVACTTLMIGAWIFLHTFSIVIRITSKTLDQEDTFNDGDYAEFLKEHQKQLENPNQGHVNQV